MDIEFLSESTNEEEDVLDQGKSLFCQQYTHTHTHTHTHTLSLSQLAFHSEESVHTYLLGN